jgi:hypothetical protein
LDLGSFYLEEAKRTMAMMPWEKGLLSWTAQTSKARDEREARREITREKQTTATGSEGIGFLSSSTVRYWY